jgi:hypothetical protein
VPPPPYTRGSVPLLTINSRDERGFKVRDHDVTRNIYPALGPGSTPQRCGARPRTSAPLCSCGSGNEAGHDRVIICLILSERERRSESKSKSEGEREAAGEE